MWQKVGAHTGTGYGMVNGWIFAQDDHQGQLPILDRWAPYQDLGILDGGSLVDPFGIDGIHTEVEKSLLAIWECGHKSLLVQFQKTASITGFRACTCQSVNGPGRLSGASLRSPHNQTDGT